MSLAQCGAVSRIAIATVLATVAVVSARATRAPFLLVPTFRAVEDHFGISMAVAGRHVLVGSLQEDYGGAAWLFDLGDGDVAVTLRGPYGDAGADYDFFGVRVAASQRLLVVTSSFGVHVHDRAGRPLALLDLPVPGNPWTAIAARGSRVVVGGQGEAARVDLRRSATRVFVPPEPSASFGAQVAFAGTRALVAAPDDAGRPGVVHAFDASGEHLWTAHAPAPSIGDGFGTALAVFGARVIVGAPGDDGDGVDHGAAYVLDARTGDVRTRLPNPGGASGQGFGVSVSGHDRVALVGAPYTDVDEPGAGVAHLFDTRSTALLATYSPLPNEADAHAGLSVALTASRVVVGGYDWSGYGTVTVYPR